MTTTHTPGPYWYATEEVGFAVGAGDREIAFVATCGTFSGGEGRANARLFHAAPDMLAALEAAEMTLRWLIELGKLEGLSARFVVAEIDRISAAIAKAKGE